MIWRIGSVLAAIGMSLLLGFAVLETAIRAFGWFAEARESYEALLVEMSDPRGADTPALETQIHPFLGWARRPGVATSFQSRPIPVFPGQRLSPWAEANRRANVFGYFSQIADYRSVPARHYAVGIFGGSVAGNLANLAGNILRDELSERLRLVDEPVEILNFGSGGYKQPQSVISLVEMAALGISLDLVINIDGFNEIVFGMLDAGSGRHPLWPSSRHYELTLSQLTGAASLQETELAGRIVEAKRRAREHVQRVEDSPWWRRSVLVRTVAGGLAARSATRAVALEDLLQRAASARSPGEQVVSLPDPCLRERESCAELIGGIWERSSRAMAAVAESIGADYVHVLQPSQYLDGSKPLSEEERAHAFQEFHASASVRKGYSLLQERGRRLRQDGIAFHDLSQVFAGRTETLYRDPCCHFNAAGNAILARAIAEIVEASVADRLVRGTDNGPARDSQSDDGGRSREFTSR